MNTRSLHIVNGVRLPFTKAGGKLSRLSVGDLGTAVVKALLARTGIDPATIDEVIMGCVCQPAEGIQPCPGDQSALRYPPIHVPPVPYTGTVLPDLNPSPRLRKKLPLLGEISF